METGNKEHDKEQSKCYHYNKGYCRYKEKCPFYHPDIDCVKECNDITCKYRHRLKCKDGENCYYNQRKACEYLHTHIDLPDVTLSSGYEEQGKAHKVILTKPSSNDSEALQHLSQYLVPQC